MKKAVHIIILVLSVLLFALGMIFLPDKVVVQISFGNEPVTYADKLFGLLLPFGLASVPAAVNLFSKEISKKYLLVSIIGVVLLLITFIVNIL